ncbi:MAG: NUDIX domain-containing protein [Gammaproteobacteria bacterium]|nr:NUDIX domain-containing protein [Gammaproteobacteria bacterium]
MNQLFLFRHGKSDWSVNVDDFNRPIKDRGKRSAQRMGIWLAQQNLQPDLIISSPAYRARTSAEKLAKAMEASTDLIHIDERLYHGSIESFMAVLTDPVLIGLKREGQKIMLVGHNPALEEFLLYLSGNGIDIPDNNKLFPTAALAHFNIPCTWSKIEEKSGHLIKIQYAKELDKQFPFPSANNDQEKRKRPAYYYSQSSVIPYRFKKGKLEVMLVQSSKRNHYVIPKGIIEPGMTAQESAQKEALEEAGVIGQIDEQAIGEYHYEKWHSQCHVLVYPLQVSEVVSNKKWQESHRGRQWMSIKEASIKIYQPAIKLLLQNLAKQKL